MNQTLINEDDVYVEAVILNSTPRNDDSLPDGWRVYSVEFTESDATANIESPVPIAAGSHLRMYFASDWAYIIRGLVVDGVVAFYRTDEEDRAYRAQRSGVAELMLANVVTTNTESIDEVVSELPEPFQRRLQKFRNNNPRFRKLMEPYELFCIVEALKLYDAFYGDEQPAESIWTFTQASDEDKRLALASWSPDHTPNTTACAGYLATVYSITPERVAEGHAALCPLLGCELAGCFSAEELATMQRIPAEEQP